jgi:hypothetical protein
MKIESTFDLKTNQVQIIFDTEMQDLLLAASRIVAKHFDAQTYSLFARDLAQNQEFELADGGRLLLELIRSKSRIIETDQERMNRLVTFLCLITIQMVKAGRPTTPLVHVLKVVANISPFPVISISLPPPNEVLDRHATPRSAWKIYQILRSTPKSETPYLSVAHAHELSFELKKTPRLRSSLKTLMVFLDASSLIYRQTLEALAAAEKTSEVRMKGKK